MQMMVMMSSPHPTPPYSTPSFHVIIPQIHIRMQQKEVLDLIETIVKPLRARIAHLEKENERMKAQLAGQTAPKHEYLRQRSCTPLTTQPPRTNAPPPRRKKNPNCSLPPPLERRGRSLMKSQHGDTRVAASLKGR
jgi:uncharacterized small protein (DUF1192 family)